MIVVDMPLKGHLYPREKVLEVKRSKRMLHVFEIDTRSPHTYFQAVVMSCYSAAGFPVGNDISSYRA